MFLWMLAINNESRLAWMFHAPAILSADNTLIIVLLQGFFFPFNDCSLSRSIPNATIYQSVFTVEFGSFSFRRSFVITSLFSPSSWNVTETLRTAASECRKYRGARFRVHSIRILRWDHLRHRFLNCVPWDSIVLWDMNTHSTNRY